MMFDFIFSISSFLFTLVFVLIIGKFIYAICTSISENKKNNQSPVLTVPVVISGKRMEVGRIAGHSGMNGDNRMSHSGHNYSRYYVTFQYESGDRQEFLVSSSEYGMLAEGDYGRLTFQGTRYLKFDRTI